MFLSDIPCMITCINITSIIHITVQFVLHQLAALNASYNNAFHEELDYQYVLNTILKTCMFQGVKLTELNISACSFYAMSLEDMDFNGCMFIEMGWIKGGVAFFTACTHTAYLFSSSCIYRMEDMQSSWLISCSVTRLFLSLWRMWLQEYVLHVVIL